VLRTMTGTAVTMFPPFTPHSLLEWFAVILNHFSSGVAGIARRKGVWRPWSIPVPSLNLGAPAQPARMPVSVQVDKIHSENECYRIVSARDARSSIINSVRPTGLLAATAKPLPCGLRKLTLLVDDTRCSWAIPMTI